MRSIKFRIWKTETKEWVSFPSRGLSSFEPIVAPVYTDSDYFIIQQFTGLRDAKGKDIYEGDIVKGFNDRMIYKVVWDEYENSCMYMGFKLKCYLKDGTIYLRSYGATMNQTLKPQDDSRLEVIGNICENPDMLKPEALPELPKHNYYGACVNGCGSEACDNGKCSSCGGECK